MQQEHKMNNLSGIFTCKGSYNATFKCRDAHVTADNITRNNEITNNNESDNDKVMSAASTAASLDRPTLTRCLSASHQAV